LQSRLEEIHAADAKVIAICADSVEKNAAAVEKLKLEFPILSDSNLKATKAFGLLHEGGFGGETPTSRGRPCSFSTNKGSSAGAISPITGESASVRKPSSNNLRKFRDRQPCVA